MRRSVAQAGHADDLYAIVAGLRAEIAALRARVERLERAGTGARDAADVTLRRVLAETVQDRTFTSRELVAHAAGTPALAAALEGADIRVPQELGTLLGRVAYRAVGGVVVERVARAADGTIWRVRVAV